MRSDKNRKQTRLGPTEDSHFTSGRRLTSAFTILDRQRKLLHGGAQLVLIKTLEKSVNVSTKFQFKTPARSKERGGMLEKIKDRGLRSNHNSKSCVSK